MKKCLLFLSLVWFGGMLAKISPEERARHIKRTLEVFEQGNVTDRNLEAALKQGCGDCAEEIDKQWWERHPRSFGAICFVGGVALTLGAQLMNR